MIKLTLQKDLEATDPADFVAKLCVERFRRWFEVCGGDTGKTLTLTGSFRGVAITCWPGSAPEHLLRHYKMRALRVGKPTP